MEAWRKVWREGFAPQMTDKGLRCLAAALESDDESLVQGTTTMPPYIEGADTLPCEGGCGVAYALQTGRCLETIGEVDAAFGECCHKADVLLGEMAACRWFLNWFDETERFDMRYQLLHEVRMELVNRAQQIGG